MRIFALIPVLAAFVTAIAGAAIPADASCSSEFDLGCVPGQLANKRYFAEHPTRTVGSFTNAELLRRGLPLNRPVLRRGTPVRRSDTSVVAAPDPEPSQPAPDPEPSQPAPDPQSSQPTTPAPVTITRRGVIQVVGGNAGSIGYISSNSPAYLSSGTDVQKALVVTFDAYQTGITSNININLEGWTAGFPLLGLVQGILDTNSVLSSNSPNYAYFAGITAPGTPPNSPPAAIGNSFSSTLGTSRTAESAVWTFDASSGALTPHWVNPDGSLPTTQTFIDGNSQLVAGGSLNQFASQFEPASLVAFNFVLL